MPIITKPVNIEKNVAALFTLDKSALAVLPSVSSDIYFSNSTNWNRVLLFYKSSVGNQKKILKFDATQVSPTSNFLASNKARNIFEIQKILIVDFDNGIFEVPRSQLTVSEFDVDMTPSDDELYFEVISGTVTRNGNEVSLSGASYAFDTNSLGVNKPNFDVTFNLSNLPTSSKDLRVGFADSESTVNGASFYYKFFVSISDSEIKFHDVNNNQTSIVATPSGTNLNVRFQQISGTLNIYINSQLYVFSQDYDMPSVKPFVRVIGGNVTCTATIDMTSASYTNWDFASLQGPYYSLNPQNQLVSNFSSLPIYSWEVGPWMLYSLDTFAIGDNGLQMVVKAEHGLISVNFNQFLGVCDTNKSIFSGFFRSEYGDNAPAVQNYAQNQYYDPPYPLSSPNNEIIFKLVMTTGQTIFYINDQIVHVRNVPVLSGATASTLVRLCTRFTNEYKIKEVTVTSL